MHHPSDHILRHYLALSHEQATQVLVLLARLDATGTSSPAPAAVRLSASARWLIGLALRVIPAAERARYAEEWRGELWDLAAGPARRRRQIAHALRTVACAWSQRRAVSEGHHRAAVGG